MIVIRILLPVLFAVTAAPLHGQVTSWRFGVEIDNDFFVTFDPNTATDHDYTHGARIWMESGVFGLLPRLLPQMFSCGFGLCRHRLSVGQEIYTPRREAAEPIDGERPHAGWLYSSIETQRIDPRAFTSFRVQIGMVGPPALGRELQTAVHRWFDFRVPQGWEHQLPLEPTVQLNLLRRSNVLGVRTGPVNLTGGYLIGADLGNALTQGEAGIQGLACVGGRLCTFVNEAPPAFGVVLRGFVGQRGVLRNVFLDGTLRDSHSVSKEPWVSTAAASLGVHVSRVIVEYERKWRGREYRSEPTGFTYGVLRVKLAW